MAWAATASTVRWASGFVAVCDVDDNKLAGKLKQFSEKIKDQPAPKAYYDYRKMLEECHKDIDVVLIATPDHHHAPAAIRAIHLGKAIFSQKPLAHDINECYALAKAARAKEGADADGQPGALQRHNSQGLRIYLGRGHRQRDRDPLAAGARLRRQRRTAR